MIRREVNEKAQIGGSSYLNSVPAKYNISIHLGDNNYNKHLRLNMKTKTKSMRLDTNSLGLEPLSHSEMRETEGGLIGTLIVIGAIALLMSCQGCAMETAGPCPSDSDCA